MQIIISKYIGFCSGVKRCVKLTEEYINKGYKVLAYGELLHNEKEIERLKKLGLKIIEDIHQLKKINNNVVLIIRTHGIEKNLFQEISNFKNINVIDGTCPIVKRNQNIIHQWTNEGYDAVIYGNIQHPEIEALISYISPKVKYYIINSSDEVENLKLSFEQNMILIAQTTKETQEYNKIIEKLKKFKNIKIFYSICKETILREKEAEDLSKQADCVIVVGGENSANTKKLVTIAKKYNENVIILNSEEDIKKEIRKYHRIGIISGASTPKWLVDKIVGKLKNIN